MDIILEMPDIVVDSTVLKRKAKLFSLVYNTAEKFVTLSWVVTTYAANDDGSYGNELSQFIPPYKREQIANNNVLVDPATGVPVEEPNDQSIGQYDFFNNMGENT